MAPIQFASTNLKTAAVARFEGDIAGLLVRFGTSAATCTAPTWTSVGTAAAWMALFNAPVDGSSRYITGVNIKVQGQAAMTEGTVNPSGDSGTDVNGYFWADGHEEVIRDSPDELRTMRIWVPSGNMIFVRLYWGSL